MGADMFYDNPGKAEDRRLLALVHELRADLVQENKELRLELRQFHKGELNCGHHGRVVMVRIAGYSIYLCKVCIDNAAQTMHEAQKNIR
jgi:hypothetical protein